MRVTKILIGLCFVLCLTHVAQAQKGLHIGFNLNPGMSFIGSQHTYGNAEFDTEVAFAWAAGGQIGYKFSHHVGLFTEVNVARLGGKWSGKDSGTFYEREVNMNYLQIPIMLKYTAKGKSRFFAMGGIEFNILQKVSQSYSPTYFEADSPGYAIAQRDDITDLFEDNTLSFVGAVGTDIVLSEKLYLTVGLKGSVSLQDINKADTHSLLRPNQDYAKSANYFGGVLFGLKYVIGEKQQTNKG